MRSAHDRWAQREPFEDRLADERVLDEYAPPAGLDAACSRVKERVLGARRTAQFSARRVAYGAVGIAACAAMILLLARPGVRVRGDERAGDAGVAVVNHSHGFPELEALASSTAQVAFALERLRTRDIWGRRNLVISGVEKEAYRP